MGRTALNAPAHRILQNIATGSPPGAAPSVDYLGSGIQDHRLAWNTANSSAGAQVLGWFGSDPITVINAVPAAATTANIAVLANVTSGTAMTLVTSSGAGITVTTTATTPLPSLSVIPAGACVIDGLPALRQFGTARTGITGFYDRTSMIGRAVSVTGVASGAGGTILVSGNDVFGYPMSELITATAGATTANGKKAFKFIRTVVPQFTDAHNYSIGTADIFGFGIQAPLWTDAEVYWNGLQVTGSSTGFTVPDLTSPATTTTGDVRGTYAVQSASDGTKRLVVRVYLSLGLLASNATTGLFGVVQA
jgi:hypothetical protein